MWDENKFVHLRDSACARLKIDEWTDDCDKKWIDKQRNGVPT